MQKIIFILFFLVVTRTAIAQRTDGLTGKRDTSYTTWSAFQSTVKKYPAITIAAAPANPLVKERMDLVYATIGQRNLHLDAFYPQTPKPRPVPAILIIHGGGWRSGDRSQHIPLARRLASLGYACFTVEYRLSTEALYPAAIHDLKSATRWLRAHAGEFNADTNRIAALGFSAGGELAAFLGTTNLDRAYEGNVGSLRNRSAVQAVIDIDGTLSFVHPESGEGDDSRSTSAATYWFGYAKKDNLPLWQDASPLAHASKNTPPFLFLNSSVDRMHAGRDDFRKILDSAGTYSAAHTFTDAPHSFCLFHPWFEPTVMLIKDFLQKVFD